MTTSNLTSEVGAAYRAGVPYCAVRTQDAPAAQTAIARALALGEDVLVYAYSPLLGLEALSDGARDRIGEILQGQDPSMLSDPATLLRALDSLPRGTATPRVIIWWGADRAWSDSGLADALLLLRDRLASRAVILMGLGTGLVTGALSGHVHPIDDALPTDAERGAAIRNLLDESSYTTSAIARTVGATRGLTLFATEQVAALAADSGTLDPTVASRRWASQLGSIPGLSVLSPMPVQWYGGNAAWIEEIREYQRARPSLVVVLDELEKIVGRPGQANDAGASDAILGELLTYLSGESDEYAICGGIAEGVPGSGKTMSGQIAASLLGAPVLRVNPSRFKGGIVGDTERNSAAAFATLRAFGGLQMWVATSNNLATIPEELADRFPSGVWFFDLPTLAELLLIWRGQLTRYGYNPDLAGALVQPGWTGRDVRAVCLESSRKGLPIEAVAARRIPAARKMARRIESMRAAAAAEGYRSASTGLAYTGPMQELDFSRRSIRRVAPPIPTEDLF